MSDVETTELKHPDAYSWGDFEDRVVKGLLPVSSLESEDDVRPLIEDVFEVRILVDHGLQGSDVTLSVVRVVCDPFQDQHWTSAGCHFGLEAGHLYCEAQRCVPLTPGVPDNSQDSQIPDHRE